MFVAISVALDNTEQTYKINMTNETIYQFALEAMSVNSFEKGKDLVMRIILAAADDKDLVAEALNYVNEEFMKAALDYEASNQSELN
jgi:hypothetical protein